MLAKGRLSLDGFVFGRILPVMFVTSAPVLSAARAGAGIAIVSISAIISIIGQHQSG